MPRNRLKWVLWIFILTLLVTIGLLVGWIIYVIQSYSRIEELALRLNTAPSNVHWVFLIAGVLFFIFVVVGLSLQFAQIISEYRLNKKQQDFLSNMTHEMNSPLAAIKLHGQTLKDGGLDHETESLCLENIVSQADRLQNLVDNILVASRLTQKKESLALKRTRLDEFLKDYAADQRLKLEKLDRKFVSDCKAEVSILADKEALTRILDNLVENAIKATKESGSLGISVRDAGEKVELEVWDSGHGIPKKELGKIFKRFYQIGVEIRGRRKGTGLGLAIVKELVGRMGGKIKVLSDEDVLGARFLMTFPKLF